MFNADEWRKILGSSIYGNVGNDPRKAVATMARQLCSDVIDDPESIEALMNCRLIPLSKNPGVRPIGIGEVLRRIIGRSIVSVLRSDVVSSSGNLQLCGGQRSGCEIAIHAAVDLFSEDDTHGILQIDARNAFNSLNRKVAVHNIKILCPELSSYITNCYARPARLFVTGGKEIASSEGTTQGDPVAMVMYAISILPLLNMLTYDLTSAKQMAFADDFTGSMP